MIKTRYDFLKRIYKDYIIVFIIKGRYYIMEEDQFIIQYFKENTMMETFKSNKLNYIIIDNLDVIEKVIFEDNRYYELLKKSLMIEITKKHFETV